MEKVFLYDASLQLLSCDPMPDGQYKLRVSVNMAKTDHSGSKAKAVPPEAGITLAVFDQPAGSWNKHTQPLYSQLHYFTKEQNVLSIIVAKKPVAVALDPYGYLLDQNRDDNVQEIK